MLSISTIASVLVKAQRSASQPTSFDTGLLLVKDSSSVTSGHLLSLSIFWLLLH